MYKILFGTARYKVGEITIVYSYVGQFEYREKRTYN